MTQLTRIDTIVQFTNGSTDSWSDINVPVPSGAIVIDTVNKIMKEGDGTNLYASLPVCLDYNFAGVTSGAVVPVGGDLGDIAISKNSMYDSAVTKLADILATIATYQGVQTIQQTRIDGLSANNVVASVSQGVVDGTIVICMNGKYTVGSKTLTQFIADIAASLAYTGGMHIDDLVWYTDSGCTKKVDSQNNITENNTYYVKVNGFHDITELRNVDFGMSTAHANVAVTTNKGMATMSVLASIYGGANGDYFQSVAVDSSDNIICVGSTNSEGAGNPTYADALVVKFDTNLNILARKIYGGTGSEWFNAVTIDKLDNIICAGLTTSEGIGIQTYNNALIVKFDTDLNVVARKVYSGANHDVFQGVTVDLNNNIIAVGATMSEGKGSWDCLIIKFDINLAILFRKTYGGINYDQVASVVVDSQNNIICAGSTITEGTAAGIIDNALVLKFDSSLNILFKKVYGGSKAARFQGVAVDSTNNIICAGFTFSEGAGSPTFSDALVVKFDPSLNILVRKIYGGSAGSDLYNNIAVDSSDNIICVGYTYSEGTGSPTYSDCLVVKFDTNLNILDKKRYGGANGDYFQSVAVDSSNNIMCVGQTSSVGLGANEALILKLPVNIPAGTFTGTTLTGLTLADSNLTSANSATTLLVSNMTLQASALTLTASALTLAVSTITQTKDTMVVARANDATTLLTTIYASAGDDHFNASAIDSVGNVIAVGSSVVSGHHQGLVVKFSSSFTALARKLYSGATVNIFNSVVIDSSDNIICIGSTDSAGNGLTDALIVKFTSALNSIVAHRTYGSTGIDTFSDVVIDPAGNIICVGITTSEGSGLIDTLVVKFDVNLAILIKKRYGGVGNDVLTGIAIDASGNAICTGYTTSEGANSSGLVLKLDANLSIVLRKYYNSTVGTSTIFTAVVILSTGQICCSGYIGNGVSDRGLVVVFDSNINSVAAKVYGSATVGNTRFSDINKDSANNLICVGYTSTEGAGNSDALVVKFSSALSILGRKVYGSVGLDTDVGVVVKTNGDIIISGYGIVGSNETNAMVTLMPSSLPVGTYTNKFFTTMILTDSVLDINNDTATVNNSTLTLADSNLVLNNASMILSDASGSVVNDSTIMDANSNVFKVAIGELLTSGTTPLSFDITANDGIHTIGKTLGVNVLPSEILACLYGGAYGDQFFAVTVDSSNNIICAGSTASEGTGSPTYSDALVVKFDASLNILARKIYGGSIDSDVFYGIAVDSSDNIICVGTTASEGAGGDALVLKFDSNLNIVARKRYGGTGNDAFNSVAVDSSNNIICVGFTYSEGTGNPTYRDALVVKFDSSLNILARKIYGGALGEYFYKVNIDHHDNIVCVGASSSVGTAGSWDALIVKFDNNLNVLAKKIYGGANDDAFYGVAFDSLNNIICAGFTYNEGLSSPTNFHALIVKYDANMNILARKVYNGSGNELFTKVAVDKYDNIICAGYTTSEGAGLSDAFVVKFDTNLAIISRKRYGGTGNDAFNSVAVDSSNNIICVGYTNSEGAGANDALLIKLPSSMPAGTFVGTQLTNLTLSDSKLNIADSALIANPSNLNLTNSTLTIANSALTLAPSTLTQTRDIVR